MKLRWTSVAQEHVLEIARYIALDNPAVAKRWIVAIRKRAQFAAQYPQSGRINPYKSDDRYRDIFEGNYQITYRIHDSQDVVEIYVVMNMARLIENVESDSGYPQ